MLIAIRIRLARPVARKRRRPFAFLVPALVGAVLLAAAARGGEAGAPSGLEVSAARRSAARAIRALRVDSPDAARLVERMVANAESATAQERTAAPWRRNPGRVETAWGNVLIASRRALLEQHRRDSQLTERWQELAQRAGANVRRAMSESQEAGVGLREISAARQAQLKWELAENFAARGELARAIPEAEQALVFAAVVHESFSDLHARFRDPRNLRKWRQMADATIARSKREGTTVFLIDKLERRLHVYTNGRRVATYPAELGAKGLRQKMYSGDQATPEGSYRVTEVRGPGRTKYYKALMLDYPNAEDRARHALGRKTGQVPLRSGAGSLIEIHGDGGQGRDWTDGCVALSNRDMDRVFAHARVGTPVTIVGTL